MGKSAAQRQRDRRQRKAQGRAVFAIECDAGATADWLVACGELPEWDAEDRAAIAAALARRLEKLTA